MAVENMLKVSNILTEYCDKLYSINYFELVPCKTCLIKAKKCPTKKEIYPSLAKIEAFKQKPIKHLGSIAHKCCLPSSFPMLILSKLILSFSEDTLKNILQDDELFAIGF
jgi:hypothetical protein